MQGENIARLDEEQGCTDDLSTAFLDELDLSNANLEGANLRNADLSNAEIKCCEMAGADFSYYYEQED